MPFAQSPGCWDVDGPGRRLSRSTRDQWKKLNWLEMRLLTKMLIRCFKRFYNNIKTTGNWKWHKLSELNANPFSHWECRYLDLNWNKLLINLSATTPCSRKWGVKEGWVRRCFFLKDFRCASRRWLSWGDRLRTWWDSWHHFSILGPGDLKRRVQMHVE